MRSWDLRLGRMIGSTTVLPLGILCASPAWADTCTGYDVLTAAPPDTADLGHGLKQTKVKAQSVVLSSDSVYNLAVGEYGRAEEQRIVSARQ